jgi:hypothetical protein
MKDEGLKKSREERMGGDRLGAVLHSNLTIIEVAEPHLLEELKADRRLGPLIVAQLSDRVAVAAPGSSDQLVKQLLKAGHTPKVLEE